MREGVYTPEFKLLRETVRKEQPYCGVCDRTTTLECHHRHYKNGGNPKREDLVMLCKECHDAITDVHRRRRDVRIPVVKNLPLPTVAKQPARADTTVERQELVLSHTKPKLEVSQDESLQSLHSYANRHKPITLSQRTNRRSAEPILQEDEVVVREAS